jgi:hypothetical protein
MPALVPPTSPPAIAPAAVVVAAPPRPLDAAACARDQVIRTKIQARPGPQKLGDLPPGRLYRALLLRLGPCSAVIVHEPGFGRGAWRIETEGLAARAKMTPADGDKTPAPPKP